MDRRLLPKEYKRKYIAKSISAKSEVTSLSKKPASQEQHLFFCHLVIVMVEAPGQMNAPDAQNLSPKIER